MKKYIVAVLLVGALLLSILFISNGIKNNEAKAAYKAAQERCGRDNPIVVTSTHSDFGNEASGIEIYAGPNFPEPGEKYYCTLTEMKNAGFSKQTLDRLAPEEVKKLYP